MTPVEREYRGLCGRIALSMLLFLGLFMIYSAVMSLVTLVSAGWDTVVADVVYQVIYGLLYAAVFTLPVLFFRLISRGSRTLPMRLDFRLPRETPLCILAGMAVISAAAYLNSLFMQPFHYSDFSSEVLWSSDISAAYQVVLLFFTTAVVPAFVEEFLFRGMILTNLLPYGRTTAILGSALLFGAMHQNAEQFLYATAAGIVLGLVYVRTGTLWAGVLLHFVNNFTSVLYMALGERLPAEIADRVLYATQGILLAAGVLAGALLLLRTRSPRTDLLRGGAFERDLPPDPDYEEIALPAARRVRLFFSPAMIVFLSLCAAEMLVYLLIAALLY